MCLLDELHTMFFQLPLCNVFQQTPAYICCLTRNYIYHWHGSIINLFFLSKSCGLMVAYWRSTVLWYTWSLACNCRYWCFYPTTESWLFSRWQPRRSWCTQRGTALYLYLHTCVCKHGSFYCSFEFGVSSLIYMYCLEIQICECLIVS
jgi:hypothetical protein